jgi:hypothetical protein
MDPGSLPGLPELKQSEEVFVVHVHMFIEVSRIRGQQY